MLPRMLEQVHRAAVPRPEGGLLYRFKKAS
jgi:hypothetical protein